ncbi:MAG: glycosyltransferase family 2 protein [Lentisphaerae bacterium]|nr:glycosyltransferase family 2 protein [Lentisphaerota bacterium]
MAANPICAAECPAVVVVIPVFNERATLVDVVQEVVAVLARLDVSSHVWVLNDASTDWSAELEQAVETCGPVSVVNRSVNEGKGAVLNWAFGNIEARHMVVIDADGEYRPAEIPDVLAPLLAGEADWVMGVRYGFGRPRPDQYLATFLVNRLLSGWFNLLARHTTADLLTGLYGFRMECVRGLTLYERRFAYTPELIWKVLRSTRPRWREVPVSYRFRSYAQGKTIRWWETFTILAATLRYSMPWARRS